MKNKSVFSQIILLILLALICIAVTVGMALVAGSHSATLFCFENLNIVNMIPVLILGGFISCVIIGICVLFITRSAFFKIKDHFKNTNDDNGGSEK